MLQKFLLAQPYTFLLFRSLCLTISFRFCGGTGFVCSGCRLLTRLRRRCVGSHRRINRLRNGVFRTPQWLLDRNARLDGAIAIRSPTRPIIIVLSIIRHLHLILGSLKLDKLEVHGRHKLHDVVQVPLLHVAVALVLLKRVPRCSLARRFVRVPRIACASHEARNTQLGGAKGTILVARKVRTESES
jgi:hypothetical protein